MHRGGQYNWNYNYHDNPYWVQFVNQNGDERDRLIGDISADYQLNDWITVTGKIARDWYRWHHKNDTEVDSSEAGRHGGFNETTTTARRRTTTCWWPRRVSSRPPSSWT